MCLRNIRGYCITFLSGFLLPGSTVKAGPAFHHFIHFFQSKVHSAKNLISPPSHIIPAPSIPKILQLTQFPLLLNNFWNFWNFSKNWPTQHNIPQKIIFIMKFSFIRRPSLIFPQNFQFEQNWTIFLLRKNLVRKLFGSDSKVGSFFYERLPGDALLKFCPRFLSSPHSHWPLAVQPTSEGPQSGAQESVRARPHFQALRDRKLVKYLEVTKKNSSDIFL